MKEIKYAKPCHFSHYGRNGYMQAHGISVDAFKDEIILNPINSRGRSASAAIAIPKDGLSELIATLIDLEKII